MSMSRYQVPFIFFQITTYLGRGRREDRKESGRIIEREVIRVAGIDHKVHPVMIIAYIF